MLFTVKKNALALEKALYLFINTELFVFVIGIAFMIPSL
ncbi:hypothetical protein KF201_2216 [Lactococcus lactis subsp. lactis]|nr:hypothetical protein KF201_2216 [Lactococcus lactis subsp. lactis]